MTTLIEQDEFHSPAYILKHARIAFTYPCYHCNGSGENTNGNRCGICREGTVYENLTFQELAKMLRQAEAA
jgi:hypothetical protein